MREDGHALAGDAPAEPGCRRASKRSAPSQEASAATPIGVGRRRLRIASISVAPVGQRAGAMMTVTDDEGSPVEGAAVSGRFGGAAGGTFIEITNAEGVMRATSEPLGTEWTVSFIPERIRAQGYYWASSLDAAHTAEWSTK